MKTISAHSPRSFLSLIFGFRFFRLFQSLGLVTPLPQNEEGGIREKSRMPPYVSIEAGRSIGGKVIPPRIWDDFHKGDGHRVRMRASGTV
jgi:hypothetical protein